MSARRSPIGASYEILFERVGRRPQELLFIDNSLSQRARLREALGMAERSTSARTFDLERELSQRGALP